MENTATSSHVHDPHGVHGGHDNVHQPNQKKQRVGGQQNFADYQVSDDRWTDPSFGTMQVFPTFPQCRVWIFFSDKWRLRDIWRTLTALTTQTTLMLLVRLSPDLWWTVISKIVFPMSLLNISTIKLHVIDSFLWCFQSVNLFILSFDF